jgi:hypothetical protein
VKFFYEQYKNGLGGVLGDDMGLVRYSFHHGFAFGNLLQQLGQDDSSHFLSLRHHAQDW